MGQILVRGLSEAVMQAFKERARRHGRSQEQEARMLIEEAARRDRAWSEFARYSRRVLRRLAERGEDFGDSTAAIRHARERR